MSEPLFIMTEEQIKAFGIKLLEGFLATAPASTAVKEELINPEELCKRLNISIGTQITYRKKGKLPFMEIGNQIRYNWPVVLKALEKSKNKK